MSQLLRFKKMICYCTQVVNKRSTKINSIPDELTKILVSPRLPSRRILHLTIEKTFAERSYEYQEKLINAERKYNDELIFAERKYNDELLNAERKYSDAEKRCSDGLRAITKLESLNIEMLKSHGQLNMRSVLDYVEDWFKQTISISYKNRKDMFIKFFDSPLTAVLTNNIINVTCYDKQEDLPDIFVRMYGKLSGSIHDRKSPDEHNRDNTKIYIVKGALDVDDCRALEQVCKFFVFPYSINYK